MDIKKETEILVQSFHFDINEKSKTKNDVNFGLRPVKPKDKEIVDDKDSYFELAITFEVAPAPGNFTVSGLINQIVCLKNYQGDGSDLSPADYTLLSRPLVEYIETLTYQVTQVVFDNPVNLNFKANF